MKRINSNIITFDGLDVFLLSVCTGYSIALIIKRYRAYRHYRTNNLNLDPLVSELKDKSKKIKIKKRKVFSRRLKRLIKKIRGGDDHMYIFGYQSKNRLLISILKLLVANQSISRERRVLLVMLGFLNDQFTRVIGIRFAVGGTADIVNILLIAIPTTGISLILGLISQNPLPLIGALVLAYTRAQLLFIDPQDECRLICKIAEIYHNKRLLVEMRVYRKLVEELSEILNLPLNEIPLFPLECVEQKLSLLERYRLRQLLPGQRIRKRVQHFSEFIKRFPQCNPDANEVYSEVVGEVVKNVIQDELAIKIKD